MIIIGVYFVMMNKEKEEKEWVVIRKLYVLSHQSCAEEELKTTKEKSNRLKMSLLGGIIGAFIGFYSAFLALIFAGILSVCYMHYLLFVLILVIHLVRLL